MKTKIFLMLCMASLMAACSQKKSTVSQDDELRIDAEIPVPVSQIDLESLMDGIDYDMDVSGLSLADVRLLRNAPAARRGYPFMDAYLRGAYQETTWYDSLMWIFDANVDIYGFDSEKKEDETWRAYYARMCENKLMLDYSEKELAFMKRLKEREDKLLKHNFDVEEGLRVNLQNLTNPRQLKEIDENLLKHLAADGFAIVPAQHEQLFSVYEQNDYSIFPSFVTTDLFLQLYHLYFDCMLRELEESSLLGLMTDFSREMFSAMNDIYQHADGDIRPLALHNAAFFSVAYNLFTGEYLGDGQVQALARPEVESAMNSRDGFSSLLSDYTDVIYAYSLYRPRGHYTRSEKLQRYFRGMMWLQAAPFGLSHSDDLKEVVMMAYALKGNDKIVKKYEKLNQLITYLMGTPDNLSIMQVLAEIRKSSLPMESFVKDDQQLAALKATLDEMAEAQTRIRPKYENTSHTKVCVMPQRYQPDAEVLLWMVDYDSETTTRATPKGLDFFAAMGVSAAEEILIAEGQKWKEFKPMLAQMKKRMGEIDWTENTATQWMNTLKVLNDKDDKLPYFMQTPEWDKKNLNASLASWAELKHDAILYAKQPFGAECGGGDLPAPIVKGYVEPNVGFWKKAIELLDNTFELLKKQGMLTEKVSESTERMREEASFLLRVSEKELQGETLTEEEYDQIKCVGATFEYISLGLLRDPDQYLMGWDDVQESDKKMSLVADVYTANASNNPNQSILYEAVGDADEIFVVVEIGGYLYLTRGAVLSYREFIRPIDEQRLTDEEWKKELESNPRKGMPDWMKRIVVPLKEMPKLNEEFFYSSGC